MKYLEINDTKIVFENIKETPRCAIYLYFETNEKFPFDGVHVLEGNLLLQGTKTKNSEQIATELENSGIEVSIDSRLDFLKVSIVCLNEDVEFALETVNDLMLNSTFNTFDKEVFKFKGETMSAMDSPVAKASDAFYREIFKNGKYSLTSTKILETIDKMTKEDVVKYHNNLLSGRKIISIAADVDNENDFLNMVSSKLSCMKNSNDFKNSGDEIKTYKPGIIKITKNDAKQAQIFQGFIVPGLYDKDYAKLCVLNNILGASGLSSRLFVELRDKKGLAYTVRSSYKTMKHGACFILYIGTEPANIKKSLEGFRYEIERIIKEPPDEKELKGAIENYTGKFKYFYTQTNSQIAGANGWNWICNLGFDYHEKMLAEIKKVTIKDVIECAEKYLLKEPVTIVLAPDEFLKF